MSVQDDAREEEQRKLFGLSKPEDEGRSGIDAILVLENGLAIPFELKTTTKGSVTTVRDFGFAHIQKWKDKHWLISKYSEDGTNMEYSLYGSPYAMSTWIKEKESYIAPDFKLAKLVPDELKINHLFEIVGEKESYTLEDAKRLNKKQFSIGKYKELMDLDGQFSPERMLEILKYRCKYLIERGSTLNNPHIPASYFKGWEQITDNHQARIRELVTHAIKT